MTQGVFVGLAGLDIIYYQKSVPPENKKSKTHDYHVAVGGPAANAAITYAMLGGRAILVTCIGESDMGSIIKSDLAGNCNIQINDLAAGSKELPNISSITVNVENAGRTIWSGQQSSFICTGVDANADFDSIIEQASFVLSDCNLYDISMKVLALAKAAGKPVVLDAGSWKENFDKYLSLADEVIASADCRCPGKSDDLIDIAGGYGMTGVAVTNGEQPIRWKTSANCGIITPPKVEALDTLGAGDVFHGAYCYFRFHNKMSFEDALRNASDVAACSVQCYGVKEGVREYLKTHCD